MWKNFAGSELHVPDACGSRHAFHDFSSLVTAYMELHAVVMGLQDCQCAA